MGRGEEILISEKLIYFNIFQTEEKAGRPPGSKAPREEGFQEVVEELSSSSWFFFQIKSETIEMQLFIFGRFMHANNHFCENFLEMNF